MLWLLFVGCKSDDDPDKTAAKEPVFDDWPDADAWSVSGPGGPAASFSDDELFTACAFLTGGDEDIDHHNHVVMRDGYLVLPWAPEDGGGGITFFDVSDPCAPKKVGEAYHELMRETHSMAFGVVDGREYLVVDTHEEIPGPDNYGGIGFWDVTDPTDPQWVSRIDIPGYHYPDAYFRVSLSAFWQGNYVFVSAGFLGLFVFDASNPAKPKLVNEYLWSPPLLLGSFHVVGNVAMASNAGNAQTAMMDVSDPMNITEIPGGFFETTDAAGTLRNYYFANIGGPWGLFARKHRGGGVIVYDLSDPADPRWLTEFVTDDGDGGYVFLHEDTMFVGDSDFGGVYDFSNPARPKEIARVDLPGDLDTVTPVGNVMVVAVDSGAVEDESSAVMPWTNKPDTRAPTAGWMVPGEGDVVPVTSRIGVSFDEMIEDRSVFQGSFRVLGADNQPVEGVWNVQENIVNFSPLEPLMPGEVTVTLPAGGIADVSGNALTDEVTWSFTVQ